MPDMKLTDISDAYALACELAKVRVFGPWVWTEPCWRRHNPRTLSIWVRLSAGGWNYGVSEFYPTAAAAMSAADAMLRQSGAIPCPQPEGE